MAAGGPKKLTRSDFSAKEIHTYTQVYERLKSGAWTDEKAALFFKNDAGLITRFYSFTEMIKDEALARIVDRSGQTALILSNSVSYRQKTLDDARVSASGVIARESNNLSVSPPKP